MLFCCVYLFLCVRWISLWIAMLLVHGVGLVHLDNRLLFLAGGRLVRVG